MKYTCSLPYYEPLGLSAADGSPFLLSPAKNEASRSFSDLASVPPGIEAPASVSEDLFASRSFMALRLAGVQLLTY